MKLIECVKAYRAVDELSQKEMPFKSAYELLRLKNALHDKMLFFAEREGKIVQKYAIKTVDGKVKITDGRKFEFISEKAAEDYSAEMKSLSDVDVEDLFVIEIPAPLNVKPVTVEALSGFVNFITTEGET